MEKNNDMAADVVQQKSINNKCYVYAFRYIKIEWGDHSCTLTQAMLSYRHIGQPTPLHYTENYMLYPAYMPSTPYTSSHYTHFTFVKTPDYSNQGLMLMLHTQVRTLWVRDETRIRSQGGQI